MVSTGKKRSCRSLLHVRVTGSTETQRALKEGSGNLYKYLQAFSRCRGPEEDTKRLYLLQVASKPPDRDRNSAVLCSTLQSSAQLLSHSQGFAHRLSSSRSPVCAGSGGHCHWGCNSDGYGTVRRGTSTSPLQLLLKPQQWL